MLYLLHALSGWVIAALALGLFIGLFARDRRAKAGRFLWVVFALLLYGFGAAAVYHHWLKGRADFRLETGLLLVAAYAVGYLAGVLLRAPFRRKAAAPLQAPQPLADFAAGAEAFAGEAGALAAAAPAALAAALAAQDFLASAPGATAAAEAQSGGGAAQEEQAQSAPPPSAPRPEAPEEEDRQVRAEAMSAAENESEEKSAEPASAPEAPAPEQPAAEDDLRLIQGMDEEILGKLRERGVGRFNQIAAWTADGTSPVADELGFGPEARKFIIAQAKLLAGGVACAATQGRRLDEAEAAALRAALPEVMEPRAHDALYAGRRPLSLLQPPHGVRDDLSRIDGIDSPLAEKLHAMGIWTFAQIARWSDDNALWIGAYLAAPDRVDKEKWVAQARAFAERQSVPA